MSGEDEMKIENKEMLLYSMDKAIDEAKIATQGEDIQEVYYRVGTAVHWIVNCMDRVFECVYFSKEDKKLRFAFHAANNALKHRCDLITLHKKNHGLSFPFTLPFSLGLHYDWADISNVKLKNENQKKLYGELLEGRIITPTFEKAKEVVHFYFDKVIEDETESKSES